MLDLLSLDEDVVSGSGINKYHKAERVPTHVWLRLLSSLYGSVAEKMLGCYKWFHRQLQETAEESQD